MTDINSNDLTVVCEREAIHAPGAIQPFGVLIAIDMVTLTVLNASTNCALAFGIAAEQLLAQSLTSYLSDDDVQLLRQHLSQPALQEAAPLSLHIGTPGTAPLRWTLYANAAGNSCILELEQDADPAAVTRALASLHHNVRAAVRSVQAATCLQQLVDETVLQVRAITGFDRVMVYRFTEEWHGNVVAEARADHMHSYLHHFFPSTDIPPQARAVFFSNWLRMIPDVGYTPVPVIPDRDPQFGGPLDLGRTGMRSVSPVHLQYLRNMDVAATLTMPLISEGKLWGLIACHHAQPKLLGSDYRMAAVTVAQLVSSQLAVKEALEDQRYQAQLYATHKLLLQHMEQQEDLIDGLVKFAPNMLDMAGATGAAAAIYFEHAWTVIGRTPSIPQIEKLVDWLGAEHGSREVFVTNHLSRLFPSAAAYKDIASGLVAISIPKSPRNFILWFRPEVATTLVWAGQPSKRMELDGGVWRLHPRFSFASWIEIVEGVATPWKKVEVDAITALRSSILAIDLKRGFAKEQAARALAERVSAEYESMVHMVSHDIRNPLSVIQMSLQMLALGAKLTPSHVEQLIGRSQRSAAAIERLVTAVLDTARVDNEPYEHGAALEAGAALADVLELARPLAEKGGVTIEATLPERPVHVPLTMTGFEQVLNNLLSNALKFTTAGGVITVGGHVEDDRMVITVADTGPGIAADLLPNVFKRFVRGKNDSNGNIGGAGLGLAIVKKIVERSGGTVEVEVPTTGGTLFRIELPVVRAGGTTST